MTTVHVRRSTVVAADPARVWDMITTFAGVNDELMPFCRMREPRSIRGRTLESYQPGETAVCWLLAGGVVPFDRHVLGLESITPGEGFVEESTTLLQRRWRHERSIVADGTGTRVTDHVTVEPRLGLMAPMVRLVVGIVFRHRHRRLVAHFGSPA